MVRIALMAIAIGVTGCGGGLSSRVVTQVRHDYHCGLTGIDGHLVSHGATEDVYDVTACDGTRLTVTCPTDARGRWQRCTYGTGTTVTVAARDDEGPSASAPEADAATATATEPDVASASASEPDAGTATEAEAPSEPPPATAAEGAARAAVDAHRAALLACTGGAAALRLDWTADGVLTATLRDARDSDEERCIQAALAGTTIAAGGVAGTALHAIAP